MTVRGALAAVLLLIMVPAPARAAPGPSDVRWSVQPSSAKGPDGRDFVIRRAAPGETLTDYVGITNLTTRPLTFTVYGTDAYNTDDGSFALLPAAQKATDIGSWIGLGAEEYTVPANTRLDVPFSITVPVDATPGDHAGGVITSIAEETIDAQGQKVLVDRRVAARVYLTVAGAVAPTLKIDTVRLEYTQSPNPADGGEMTVSYLVRNTGNLRLSGAGAVRVTGPFGWELARTEPMAIPELLPGGAVTVTERIVGVQPTVRLNAEVTVEPANFDRKLPAVTRGTTVWAWPWALVILLSLAVLYLGSDSLAGVRPAAGRRTFRQHWTRSPRNEDDQYDIDVVSPPGDKQCPPIRRHHLDDQEGRADMTDFSTRLRRATMVEHREAETRSFISRLMAGAVPMAGFAALTAQYLAVYRELEAAADRMRAEAGPAAGFADPALTRVPSLEADLAHLYGPDWESAVTVLDSTVAYAARLRELAAVSPHHFIAHHYVRYLGDLSGGQMIGRTLANLYGLGDAGTSFYRFEQISDARAYKIAYRERLDALHLPDDEATTLIDEAQLAFRYNAAVFVELGAHYPENPEDLASAA